MPDKIPDPKPDDAKLVTRKQLRAAKPPTALAFVELTIRMTPPQYRILNALATYAEVTVEAFASNAVSNYTAHVGERHDLREVDREYLRDKFGW